MDKWIITYARMTIDKEQGIILNGIYFGGITDCSDQADTIARECVNTIKGGTVLPKIVKITSDSIMEAVLDVEGKFHDMANRMRDADSIINRNNRK